MTGAPTRCGGRHPRGTLLAYKIDKCRCGACTAANRRYGARRSRLLAYGQWAPLVDAGPARDHIAMVGAAGLGQNRLAEVAEVSLPTVWRIAAGRTRRVRPQTATAILAVRADLDTLDDRALTDAAGTRRRLEALAVLGWSLGEQSARTGRPRNAFSRILTAPMVQARTARDVRALYSQLWDTPPPPGAPGSERARRYAARSGWLPPVAWDDDLIDLPDTDLQQELARRAALMDDDEARACATARSHGDRSPLVIAGAREHSRRRSAAKRGSGTQTAPPPAGPVGAAVPTELETR